ncbi:M13 family metallopeptidase [Xylocopilactobacillus apicola]|uniref:Peptidase M13 n=1 Tax=Xylocopilactobacillus apicola TaxID=2932184 RepID=A0AAU9D8Z1_9LACO|nr:M13-type metalloendopeptidase [Xylocopilactobacillus apicola]BDR58820.1 peptidase M13 [Xylocopilactobacillus apicola]
MQKVQKMIGGAGDLLAGKETKVQDNLYLNVNGKWLETAKIPSDRPRTGGFSDLAEGVEKKLRQDLADFAKDLSQVSDSNLKEAVKFYQLAHDYDQRDHNGVEPAMDNYNFYKGIKDLADLKSKIKRVVTQSNFALNFWVSPDMKNTARNLLYVGAPSLLLPDKQYYGTASEDTLIPIFKRMSQSVLASYGESEANAEKIIQNMLDFDHLLVPLVKSSEEKADYTKSYNPVPFTEFSEKTSAFGLGDLITELAGVTPELVSLTEPRYFDSLAQVLNEETFPKFRDWMLLNTAIAATPYLSDQLRIVGGEFGRAISGIKEASNQDKSAYRLTNNFFDEIIGVYYGAKYFGPKARADVKTMINTMIKVYEQRLQANSWLSETTIKKAIDKLEAIELKIGYPDQPRKIYQKLKVDSSSSLYQNVQEFSKILRLDNFKDLNRPVDRTRWAMPGNMVNACYDPQVNDITFPAAILQAPFYSIDQTSSQNYGGIGAVIAHEISHAFDNNGAKFDEFGNMKNWWTEKDYEEFEKRCQAMIDQFNGIKFGPSEVNGKLVVSENVADQGGLSCALEAAKKDENVDLKEFFENWGRIWQTKDSPQLVEMLLAIDVHAPAALRANVQAQNLDEFYETFDVSESDGMWLPKDQRVAIW